MPLAPLADSSHIGIILGASMDFYVNPRLAFGGGIFYLGFRKKHREPGVIRGGNLSIMKALVRLKYYLHPAQKSWRSYKVFNRLGKEVITLVDIE